MERSINTSWVRLDNVDGTLPVRLCADNVRLYTLHGDVVQVEEHAIDNSQSTDCR